MKKYVLKTMLIALVFIAAIGCSRNKGVQSSEQSSTPDLVDYTVGLSKKIKSIEPGVQFWSSGRIQLMLCYTCNSNQSYSVDDQGVIIIRNENENNSFIIPKNCPGVLVKIEKGIYWIRFDLEDSRLVPFKKVGDEDSYLFELAVQAADINKVRLDDGRLYSRSGNSHLRVSKKFADGLKNKSKTASGVKIGGE